MLRQTNALRSSMIRMTMSKPPTAPIKTQKDWQTELDAAVAKFHEYLVDFAGMDKDEAEDFAVGKIEKAMDAQDDTKVPKHLKEIIACKKSLEACIRQERHHDEDGHDDGRDDFASGLLDRAERSLRQSLSMRAEAEDSKEESDASVTVISATGTGTSRVVVTASRTAQANQFHEGEEHVGEVAQVVRGKFGFIVAETTGTSRRVLKQKIFFHMKDAPANVRIGDRVKFMVMCDPYNKGKMIAKQMSTTKKAAPGRGGMLNDVTSGYNNSGSSYNHDGSRSGGRADSDNNWRRGFGGFGGGDANKAKASSSSSSWFAFNRRGGSENRRRW